MSHLKPLAALIAAFLVALYPLHWITGEEVSTIALLMGFGLAAGLVPALLVLGIAIWSERPTEEEVAEREAKQTAAQKAAAKAAFLAKLDAARDGKPL